MVIVLEKELAAISMRPVDDVKPVLDKIKDTYARMAAAGSSVSQLQQCTKIISVLDNSWDNLIPTPNSQQDQWTPDCIKNLWQLPIIPWNGKTPTAATTAAAKATWYGSAPAVNMLRAFGCMVAFHVPKEKRGKLEASGRWALHHGAKEMVWLRRLLEELGVGQEEPTVVFCDNESAVKLAKNACLHGLTKHIRPKWHWVRRLLDKEVRLETVKTHQQAADIFTKRLAEADHWKGMKLAGMSVH
ncbi:hypothetical protein CLOM_g8076 [Closterium sp. NIES-68]|nr:hypothetical protein CLOM_g8076 [Closterium sp. NIES-68]